VSPLEQFVFTLTLGCAVVTTSGGVSSNMPEFLADLVLSDGRTWAQHREEWDCLGTRVVCEMDRQNTDPVADWLPGLCQLFGR
jgi:hypothetical protein